MKNPLSYQTTEYDCGPTTVLNALSYLFKREEILPDIVKWVMLYCLDAYNDKGEFGKSGTSAMAMQFLCNWLNQFGKAKHFPIYGEFLIGEEVYIGQNSRIVSALQQGGAVVVRLIYGGWHYALLTGVEDTAVYLFDPYYRKRPFQEAGIEMIWDAPTRMNRKIEGSILNSEVKKAYALGPLETREATILFNTETRKTPDKTIEYFI